MLLYRNLAGGIFRRFGFPRISNITLMSRLKFKKVQAIIWKRLMMKLNCCKKQPSILWIKSGWIDWRNIIRRYDFFWLKKFRREKLLLPEKIVMLFNSWMRLYTKVLMGITFVWFLRFWEWIFLRLSNVMNIKE